MNIPLDGKRVFFYFLLFFGIVAAVNAAMVTIAVRTNTGIVTEHPYEKGVAYNRTVEAEEKQEELGWKGKIEYKNGVISFLLHDKDNAVIEPERATASISRPTQAGMDFTVELKGAETQVAFPAKGLWEVRIDTLYKGEHYQQSKRIVVE